MWNELAKYRNHYLQKEIENTLKAENLNEQQNKEWNQFINKRGKCKIPSKGCMHSTYFDDRAQLAYGWFALPKLMREMDSDSRVIHWRAIKSISEFLLNPLHCERAINEMDIVRKIKNAFMRLRLNYSVEEYNELETLLDIYIIISRNINGAVQIAGYKCLIEQFYKLAAESNLTKCQKATEILINLSGKPKVLGMLLDDEENYKAIAGIFQGDICQPYYAHNLWVHLTHFLEWSPVQAIELGFFEYLYKRIKNRLPEFYDMTMKSFALILRCVEGQKLYDDIDGVQLLQDILINDQWLPTFEYVVLAFMNGLHSKRALWRSREFTTLPDRFGLLAKTRKNPLLQLYCLQTLRELAVMPCIKRYIIGNWLRALHTLKCLNMECELARDTLVDYLRRDYGEA